MKKLVFLALILALTFALLSPLAVMAEDGDDTLVNVSEMFPANVYYNANTTDNVYNMPADEVVSRPSEFQLPAVIPTRDDTDYMFVGWSLEPDGRPLMNYSLTGNTTLYAVWGRIAEQYTFGTNGNTHPGFDTSKLTAYTEADDYIEVTLKRGVGDWRPLSFSCNIDPRKIKTVVFELAPEDKFYSKVYYKTRYLADDGTLKFNGYDIDNFMYAESLSVQTQIYDGTDLDTPIRVAVDLTNDDNNTKGAVGLWAYDETKVVKSMYFDPFKNGNGKSVRLYSITLIADTEAVYFDSGFKTDEQPANIPATIYGSVGDTVQVRASVQPTMPGYIFMGWSLDKYASSGSKTLNTNVTFTGEDVVYYAIWDIDEDTPHTMTYLERDNDEGIFLCTTLGFGLQGDEQMIAVAYRRGRIIGIKVFSFDSDYELPGDADTIKVFTLDSDLVPVTQTETFSTHHWVNEEEE